MIIRLVSGEHKSAMKWYFLAFWQDIGKTIEDAFRSCSTFRRPMLRREAWVTARSKDTDAEAPVGFVVWGGE